MIETDWVSLDGFEDTPSAVTIGVFDGLHRGHRALIERVVDSRWKAVVVTFQRHPTEVLLHDRVPGFIMSLAQKRETLRAFGVDVGVLIDFNDAFRRMPGREFLEALRSRFSLRRIVVGHDFRCGYRLDTDASVIREFFAGEGVEIIEMDPLESGGRPISSTRIRAMIQSGDLADAGRLLGRPFSMDLGDEPIERDGDRCYVVKSDRGLMPGSSQLVPPPGVYRASADGKAGEGREFELHIGENSLSWPLAAGESIRYIVMKERRY